MKTKKHTKILVIKVNTGVHYFQMGKQLIPVIKMSQTKSLPELAVETRLTASCGRCHKTENMAENDGKIYDRSDWCVEGRENGGEVLLKNHVPKHS